MTHDSRRGDSLGMGLPGDAVTRSLGTILAGKAGPQGEAQDGPSNPAAVVYWAEVACGASAGRSYDRV